MEFERVYYPAVRPQFERFFLRLGSASLFKHNYTTQPLWKVDSLFHCDKCEKTFKRMSHLKRHEVSVHFGKKESCPHCGLNYSRKDNLEAHIISVHGTKSKSFQCEVCQETFNKKLNYQRHVNNIKTNCSICSDIFCTLKQLQQHRTECHSQQSNFECCHCKEIFSSKFNMKTHIAHCKQD